MGIKKNKYGKWEARISLGFDERGKRIQKSFTSHRKREVEYWVSEQQQARKDGSIKRVTRRMTVEVLCDEYMENMTGKLAKATMYKRRSACTFLKAELGKMKVEDVRTHHLSNLLSDEAKKRNWKPDSFNTMVRQIRAVFLYAEQQQYIEASPGNGLTQFRKGKKTVREVWTPEDTMRFVDVNQDDLRALPLILILYTGMRLGETITLRWSDVDLKRKILTVHRTLDDHNKGPLHNEKEPKGGRIRHVALSDEAVEYLERAKRMQRRTFLETGFRNIHDYVCLTQNGRPYNPSYLHRHFTLLAEKADVERIRIHDLRHTHATLLLGQGVHPKVVQERLGHANYAITMDLYSHVSVEMQQKAAEMLSFKKSGKLL